MGICYIRGFEDGLGLGLAIVDEEEENLVWTRGLWCGLKMRKEG